MLSRSAQFDEAVLGSHAVVVQVDALLNGEIIESDLPLSSGSVAVDSGSATRRQLTATFPDLALWDVLSRVGVELSVQRGVAYPDGTKELLPVGVFEVQLPKLTYGAKSISVSGPDRWQAITRARFVTPKQWDPTWSTIDAAIEALALGPWADRQAVDPNVHGPGFINQMPGTGAAQRAAVWARDRNTALTDLATAVIGEVFLNPVGDVQLRPIPTLGTPVWDASTGPDGVLSAAEKARDTGTAYNTVVVTGVDPSGATTVTATAQITAPTNPLWIGGPMGVVPYFYSSALITTHTQAQAVADLLLDTSAAVAAHLTASCIPNPALETGDTVQLFLPDGTVETHILQSFTLPLDLSTPTQDVTLQSNAPIAGIPVGTGS